MSIISNEHLHGSPFEPHDEDHPDVARDPAKDLAEEARRQALEVKRKRGERSTPQALFDALDGVFHFDWDVAAVASNGKVRGLVVRAFVDRALLPRYFGPDHPLPEYRDALAVSWLDVIGTMTTADDSREMRDPPTVWCNPPWGRGEIAPFCAKAAEQAALGVTTVMLLPADPSTEWFRDWVLPREHYWMRGRNAYEGEAAVRTADGELSKDKKGCVLVLFRPPLPDVWLRAR